MNIKTIVGFALGPIAGAALGILTVPLVAWAFSPEDVGRLNVLQVLLSFSLLLLVLGLDQAYVREFHGSNDRAHLLKACFTPGFILLFLGALLTAGFGSHVASWLFGEANVWYYPLTLVCVVATYISRFLSLILRMNERGVAFSMSQIVPKIAQLALLCGVIFVGFPRSFLTLLWIATTSTLVVVVLYAWNTRQQWMHAVSIKVSISETRTLLKFGFPLVFSGLAYWGLTATSIIVLHHRSTLGEIGIYSVASSFAAVAAVFQSIFTVIWAPAIYKLTAKEFDVQKLENLARQALALVCAIFVSVGTFSWLADYMLPSHYADVKYLVLCAIVPPMFYTLSEVTGVGIGISRRTMLSVWVTLAALATNLLLGFWLIPHRGASGAVVANAISYLVFFIARTEAAAYVWYGFPRKKIYFFASLMTVLAIASVVVGAKSPIPFAFFWILSIPFLGWSFRGECSDIAEYLRRERKSLAIESKT